MELFVLLIMALMLWYLNKEHKSVKASGSKRITGLETLILVSILMLVFGFLGLLLQSCAG